MTQDNIDPKHNANLSSERLSEREALPLDDTDETLTKHARDPKDASQAPKNIKDSKAAQFEYGRKSQHATEHFDRHSRRLESGNPDVGEIDLGNIEADRPAEPDDKDFYD